MGKGSISSMQEAGSEEPHNGHRHEKKKEKEKEKVVISQESHVMARREAKSRDAGTYEAAEAASEKKKFREIEESKGSREGEKNREKEAGSEELRKENRHKKKKEEEMISQESNAMEVREANSGDVGSYGATDEAGAVSENHTKKKKKRKMREIEDTRDFEVVSREGSDEKKKRRRKKESSGKDAGEDEGSKSEMVENARKKLKQAPCIEGKRTANDGVAEALSSFKAGDGKNTKRKKKKEVVADGLEPIGEDKVDKGTTSAGKEGCSDDSNIPKTKKTPKKPRKRVSFSGKVEVFPPTDDADDNTERPLIQGKRFTPEEDALIIKAVEKYIQVNQLGEDGLHMILKCKKYPQVKNCWKEIGASLHWRPYQAIYYRTHCLYERSEKRKWDPEEIETLKRLQKTHGSNWKTIAAALGKHRIHVKDTWRRIKFLNRKPGHWSQEEYQGLFDLVNFDLRMKAYDEKKSKHGMLRDNISWEAISNKLSTRHMAACCMKWYGQLTSPLVSQGVWADVDDYRMLDELQKLDACCVEDVDWDNLLEQRSGEICRKRWDQMIKHIGGHREKSFVDQVEVISKRYSPEMIEYRKD